MILTPRPSRQPQRPCNLEAWHQLMAVYAAAPRPFTRDVLLRLGRLYVQAWGVLPSTNRLNRGYGMPGSATIMRVFGSTTAFRALLQDQGDG
jgi:hypothetical protein